FWLLTSCNSTGSHGANPKPIITSIKPDQGTTGTNVTIKGSNFSVTNEGSTVKFGSEKSMISHAENSKLIVAVPSGLKPSKEYSVKVTVGTKSSTAPKKFKVISPLSSPIDTAGSVPKDGVLEAVTWNIEMYKASANQKIKA